MPLVDIQPVCPAARVWSVSAQTLTDAQGEALGSHPGATWVRMQPLRDSAYAENGLALEDAELPVFVTILHAHPPIGALLAAEVEAVTTAVVRCLGRAQARVHVEYAPPGAGRQAFGGQLVG